jgi:hypothetical protein
MMFTVFTMFTMFGVFSVFLCSCVPRVRLAPKFSSHHAGPEHRNTGNTANRWLFRDGLPATVKRGRKNLRPHRLSTQTAESVLATQRFGIAKTALEVLLSSWSPGVKQGRLGAVGICGAVRASPNRYVPEMPETHQVRY